MTGIQGILDKATYNEYLERLDARAVLEHYGAENCTEQVNAKDGSTEVVHSCLLDRVEPHHSNGDKSPSASCNLENKQYVCYSMGFGCDLFHLVMKLEGKESLTDSMSMIGQFLTGATLDKKEFQAKLTKLFEANNSYSISLPSYDDAILNGFKHPHVYWDHRGITQQAQEALHLGYDPREKRIIFPHYVQNTLVGWQKRVVPGETFPEFPKYKNTPGFPKSETLYNLDTASRYPLTCVVESPMSVAKAMSLGIPNTVATFGAKVTDHQISLLRQFDKVYVWFDRDAAGMQGEKNIVEKLHRHTPVMVVTPDGGRDLGDCDENEIAFKLNHAMPAAIRLGEYAAFRRMK
jgi:DNA primase